jgi:hypothetical protein
LDELVANETGLFWWMAKTLMLDGLDHVRKAAEILVNRDGLLKERLEQAAGEFGVSLMQPNEGPQRLLPVASAFPRMPTCANLASCATT